MIICGIYEILNTVTGKSYVGSSVDIHRRWGDHRKRLKKSGHHSPKLQNSWNKHGSEIWKWSILQECEEVRLLFLEAFWMARLDSVNNGYNLILLVLEDGYIVRRHSLTTCKKRGASIQATRAKWTEEEKMENGAKISLGRMNRSDEAKAETSRISSLAMMGHKPSQETCAKLSSSLMGHEVTQETRDSISLGYKNQTLEKRAKRSENISNGHKNRSGEAKAETSKKLSDIFMGHEVTQGTRDKMSLAKLGKKRKERSPEHRERLSASAKKAHAKKKAQKLAESQQIDPNT